MSKRPLGEHEIIALMRQCFEVMPNMAVPFGDDVSAVPLGEGEVAVLKADMLVGKTDVPTGMSYRQAGRKAVVMNISDFAAKGVVPQAVLVSLGLPCGLDRKHLVALAEGLNAGAREFGAYVVGGDTGESSDLIVSVQLFGSSRREGLMLRSGAAAGDVLAVTGGFGKSPAGLMLMLNDDLASVSPKVREALVNAVCLPMPRLKEGLALRGCGAVSASMDSSDGLAWCLHEIAALSGVGFEVNQLPVADEAKAFAEANKLDVSQLVLYGGEEYELVVAVKPELWTMAVNAVEAAGGKLLQIGKATKNKQVVTNLDGKIRVIDARGYEHFKTR